MSTKEILVAARARLADPAHWTKGCFARDTEGLSVNKDDDKAVCWCLAGAILKESPNINAGIAALMALEQGLDRKYLKKFGPVPEFNDSEDSSHKDVISLLDKTITSIES